MASTSEIMEKVYDSLWPFHPDHQPEALVTDFEAFKGKVFKSTNINQHYALKQGEPGDVSWANNPFERPDNEELSFIGRDLNKESEVKLIMTNHYKQHDFELYGPMWVYVTLLVEFVILGHLTNQI